MKVWNAIMVAVLCALALMYFDSTEKEKPDVRNSPLRSLSRDFRIDIGNLSVYRVCVVPSKSGRAGRKIVKCPVCDQWVSVLETRSRDNNETYRRYRCANEHRFVTHEKVERVILVTQRKKK
jgi:hypothetical protein